MDGRENEKTRPPRTAKPQQEKTCRKCNQAKSAEEFAEDQRTSDGRRSQCKACLSQAESRRHKSSPAVRGDRLSPEETLVAVRAVDGYRCLRENPKDVLGNRKPSPHYIPPAAIIQTSMAMAYGAARYGGFNWRQHSIKASVYISAAYRHLMQWWDGEDIDPESGVSHLGHAMACMAILIDAINEGKIIDDRPPKGHAAELIRDLTRPAESDSKDAA